VHVVAVVVEGVGACKGVVVDYDPNAGVVVEVDDVVLWFEVVEVT